MEAFGLKNRIKGWAKRAVIVMDQEPQWLFSVGKFPNQLPGLLRNPDLIGVGGNTRKMDAARPQFNEEKHVYSLKKDSFHCEEIIASSACVSNHKNGVIFFMLFLLGLFLVTQ